MNKAIIDTDILSYFFKGNIKVQENFNLYLNYYDWIEISIITYYEIRGGLLAINATRQLNIFEDFISQNFVVPITEESVKISADLYSTLKKSGNTIDDIDLLIAGIAIENNLTLITNNEKHFNRIPGLNINNWS